MRSSISNCNNEYIPMYRYTAYNTALNKTKLKHKTKKLRDINGYFNKITKIYVTLKL